MFFLTQLSFVGICLMLYIHFFNFVFYSRIFRVNISVLCWDFSFEFFRTHTKALKNCHTFFIIKLELWHADGLQGFGKNKFIEFQLFFHFLWHIHKFSLEFTEEAQICVRRWYTIVLLSADRRLRNPNNRYECCSFVRNHMNHYQ